MYIEKNRRRSSAIRYIVISLCIVTFIVTVDACISERIPSAAGFELAAPGI